VPSSYGEEISESTISGRIFPAIVEMNGSSLGNFSMMQWHDKKENHVERYCIFNLFLLGSHELNFVSFTFSIIDHH